MEQGKKYCNLCGRELHMTEGILREDVLVVEKEWGFFSKKDTQVHSFCICEQCYDRWTADFRIPPQKREKTEVI